MAASTFARIAPYLLIPVAVGGAILLARSGDASASVPTIPGRIPGTIFTILFENKDRPSVIGSSAAPFFTQVARTFNDLRDYVSGIHPSLPNYILLTSGSTQGITDDTGYQIDGEDNLAAQMDAAGISWRAYSEGTTQACDTRTHGRYASRHLPFVYYTHVYQDADYCASHVVPFGDAFVADLARGDTKYMWITPDMCNNMHDCDVAAGDRWLAEWLPLIMASPGYQNGGAIFILFDEGIATHTLPAVLVSPLLRYPGMPIDAPLGHRAYLATVEDLLGLPRLATTVGVPSMAALLNV